MKKDEFIKQVTKHGDAIITYRSQNSRRLKYNVCTLDFDNKYIQSKRNRARPKMLAIWANFPFFFCTFPPFHNPPPPTFSVKLTPTRALKPEQQKKVAESRKFFAPGFNENAHSTRAIVLGKTTYFETFLNNPPTYLRKDIFTL